MDIHHAAAQRNMRLVVGLLESIPEQGLTDVEWEFLNSLILGARLLCSAVVSRTAQNECCLSPKEFHAQP